MYCLIIYVCVYIYIIEVALFSYSISLCKIYGNSIHFTSTAISLKDVYLEKVL